MWFDGGSRGNPGVSGAGAVLHNASGVQVWSGCKYLGAKHTNNEAEYTGLVIGLKAALEGGYKRLIINGDSTLVVKQMQGIWQCKAGNLMGLYREACKLAQQFAKLQWNFVYRHLNNAADAMANRAMDSRSDYSEWQQPDSIDAADSSTAAAGTAAAAAGAAAAACDSGDVAAARDIYDFSYSSDDDIECIGTSKAATSTNAQQQQQQKQQSVAGRKRAASDDNSDDEYIEEIDDTKAMQQQPQQQKQQQSSVATSSAAYGRAAYANSSSSSSKRRNYS
eukprot:11604-Heterococcus_DN1.PRE.1